MTQKITRQMAFTMAVTGLYAQGAPATNDKGTCRYRDTATGFKCGVGFLIPDDIYRHRFESLSAARVFETSPAFNELFDPEMDKFFLTALQTDLHDNYVEYVEDSDERNQEAIPYKRWLIQSAEDFTRTHSLTMPEIESASP